MGRVRYRFRLREKASLIAMSLAMLGLWMIFPSHAQAVPAFARKYDLSCTSCHTKPPRLNPFGEAFNMSGFNIPATTKGGEVKKKRKIGRVRLERSFLNIFAMRVVANFVESFEERDHTDADIVFPHEVEFFFAGTLTNEISYFFEPQFESPKLEGAEDGKFAEEGAAGLELGRSFLIFNLSSVTNQLFSGKNNPIGIGPMIRIGNLDPSTFFSFPFERQYFKGVPGKVGKDGKIQRFTVPTPYALASKFFGVMTGKGEGLEVTQEVLYNGEGMGVDLHALVGNFILQAGIQTGIGVEQRDVNAKKDPYLMGRYNFGWQDFISGSVSAFVNWGNDTAMVDHQLIDWFRYGVAGNIKLSHVDLYGVFIWDKLSDLPDSTRGIFEKEARGLTLQADYLATDKLLLMARYDYMDAGGFLTEGSIRGQMKKTDGQVLSLQARYYLRDNLSLILRDSYNLAGLSDNPLRSYRNLIVFGLDFDW